MMPFSPHPPRKEKTHETQDQDHHHRRRHRRPAAGGGDRLLGIHPRQPQPDRHEIPL